MITYNVKWNPKAKETIERMKKVANEVFNTDLRTKEEDWEEQFPTIHYGISGFDMTKSEQAQYFEDILPNTIVIDDNYDVLQDHDYVIMKNPTRIMLWKDAKKEQGTKYLYIKNKVEWRINYAFGKVNSIFNKNIGNEIFGKSNITQWTPETDETIRATLKDITLKIAKKVDAYNNGIPLRSFGLDIIYDINNNEYLFLELNQANSLSEKGCEFYLQAHEDFLTKKRIEEQEFLARRYKRIDDFIEALDKDEYEYLITKYLETGD